MSGTKKCKGFILIREYPNSRKLGSFEPYTTGEFLKYPEIWKPVYDGEEIKNNEYIILSNGFSNELEVAVNNAMKNGYKPIGGVAVSNKHGYNDFTQALIKK